MLPSHIPLLGISLFENQLEAHTKWSLSLFFSFCSMLELISVYWTKTKILLCMSNATVKTKSQLRLNVSRNWYVVMFPACCYVPTNSRNVRDSYLATSNPEVIFG